MAGQNILVVEDDKHIGKLVKYGLDEKMQKAMDVVRLTGNDAVHAGLINFDDGPEIAYTLFDIVNLIISKTITLDRKTDELLSRFPKEKLDAIKKRDKSK